MNPHTTTAASTNTTLSPIFFPSVKKYKYFINNVRFIFKKGHFHLFKLIDCFGLGQPK
jgi:hypothetical protein